MRTIGRMVAVGFCATVVTVAGRPAENVHAQTPARPAPVAPPPGFLPPPLNPTGVTLETRRLADGVYALVANTPFTDNSGFVVGRDAVLVVDSQFNGQMGRQVLEAVRRVTDRPIRYLVNTNAFGDHTFGNYVFPASTQIVASRGTVAALRSTSVTEISSRMASTVDNDLTVFADTQLRVPDVAFDERWSVDLGGMQVEAYFFGPGMSPNDTVVYVPAARVAWTGNLIFGDGTIPWVQSGGVETYRRTLAQLSLALRIDTIVPGHAALTAGDIVGTYQQYLGAIQNAATEAIGNGLSLEKFAADAQIPSPFRVVEPLRPLMTGFHRWNLQRAYTEATRTK